jgi:hypothetical protein
MEACGRLIVRAVNQHRGIDALPERGTAVFQAASVPLVGHSGTSAPHETGTGGWGCFLPARRTLRRCHRTRQQPGGNSPVSRMILIRFLEEKSSGNLYISTEV